MENVIDSIRAAIAPEATPEARAQGIDACRAILAALGAKPGEPLGSAPRAEPGPVATAIASVIRSTPPDQLFDMLIAKLRTVVPADTKPVAPMFRLQRVPVPTP
jgi:hypothetical protein